MTDATTEELREQIAKAIFLSRSDYPTASQLWDTRDEGSMLDSQFMTYADAVLPFIVAARRAGMEEAVEIARNVYATSQAAVLQRKRTVAAINGGIDHPASQ